MDLGIKGRVAIVSGGSRGIGRATAKQFLEEGVRVMTCSRNGAESEATCKELAGETGGEIRSIQADMTKAEDVQRLVDETMSAYGTVDILVNNAGTMYSGRFDELTEEGLQSSSTPSSSAGCGRSGRSGRSCLRKSGAGSSA